MKCWYCNKNNPINKVKPIKMDSTRMYNELPEVVAAISTVKAICKSKRRKERELNEK